MATAVVSIICIVLIVLGGMSMSQGILTSADTTALSVEEISAREGEIMRTEVAAARAAHLSWADRLRVTVNNSGQTKLASFSKWDLIVNYYDGEGNYYTKWLPYTEGTLADNEWQKARVCLNGQPEFFEPGIINPEEELVILAKLSPLPGDNTTGEIIVSTPNGICDSLSFYSPGYTLLTPHSENTTIAGTDYYQLAEATPADGTTMTVTTDVFTANETNRKLMHNENDSSRLARHVFPLTGISKIPASTWTVYYRCRTWGDPEFPDNDGDVNFNIDILVRKSDGTLRTTIATDVANAYLTKDEAEVWVTKNGTYNFLEYNVIDDSDYLEIVYYGETDNSGPKNGPGYLQIRIDDNTLAEAGQTRIEA
jgi:hypothetical protein